MTKKDKDLASARIQLEHIKGILEQTMELVDNIDKTTPLTKKLADAFTKTLQKNEMVTERILNILCTIISLFLHPYFLPLQDLPILLKLD